jgi:hypothetical protein
MRLGHRLGLGLCVLLVGCGGPESVRPFSESPVTSPPVTPPEVTPPAPAPAPTSTLELQWIREVADTDRHAARGAALTSEGATVLLDLVDLVESDADAYRDWATWALHAWSADGTPQWSRRLAQRAPYENLYAWDAWLHASSTGPVLGENLRAMWEQPTNFDFGCGPGTNRLMRFDAQGRCVSQRGFGNEILELALSPAGDTFVLVDGISESPNEYQHLDAAGLVRHSATLSGAYPSRLSYVRDGELAGLQQGQLVLLSPALEPLHSLEAPVDVLAQLGVAPDGKLAVVGAPKAEGALTWGTKTLPRSAALLLVLGADGAPGAALALDRLPSQVAADASGVVLAFKDEAGLEVRSYDWNGALQASRHIAVAQPAGCGLGGPCPGWSVGSLTVDPVYGVRISGTLTGPLHFASSVAGTQSELPRAYVLALRR